MILVTGGAGYIGSKLIGKLLDENYSAQVMDNFSYGSIENLKEFDIEIIKGDITNPNDVENAMRDIEFVFDLAAISSVPECSKNPKKAMEVNAYGTRVLLEEIKKQKVDGFLFPSSVASIYGDPQYSPVDENHPVKPVNDYGIFKRTSELFCIAYHHMYNIPITVVRQSNVYGPSPGMRINSVVQIFIKKALEGEPLTIYGSGNQVRNFIFIDDLLDAYLKILKSPKVSGEIYNLGGSEISIRDLALKVSQIIGDEVGKDIEVQFKESRQEAESKGLVLSTKKAKNAFGFDPKVSIEQGIKKTMNALLVTQ